MNLTDDGSRTSPCWSRFDPGEIVGDSWVVASSAPAGFIAISAIRAPASGGTLVFKQGARWREKPPGSTQDVDNWNTKTFTEGESLVGVQITEVRAGSTSGEWEILL